MVQMGGKRARAGRKPSVRFVHEHPVHSDAVVSMQQEADRGHYRPTSENKEKYEGRKEKVVNSSS